MSDGHDETSKRAILARRARFVALALASAGVGAFESSCARACLSAVPTSPNEAGTDAETDDAAAASADAGASPASDADASSDAMTPPMPCLSVRPPPRDAGLPPMVCLSMLPPARDAGPQPCLKVAPGPNDEP